MIKPAPLFAITWLALVGCSTTGNPAAHLERKHYGKWEQPLGYTQAVRKNQTLYLSGIGSAGATLEEQLDGIYRTAQKILTDYGATSAHVAKEVIYTTDIEALEKANAIRKQFYGNGQYPSSSWVQVARLLGADMQVEIEFIVELPPQ